MTENEVSYRFDLLKQEIGELQQALRHYESLRAQIAGWAITLATATAAFAISTGKHPIALLGTGASVAFWVLEAHRRALQARVAWREEAIEAALGGNTIEEALGPGSTLRVPGIASEVVIADWRIALLTTLDALTRPTLLALYVPLVVTQIGIAIWA
jgi:hypothetical protein